MVVAGAVGYYIAKNNISATTPGGLVQTAPVPETQKIFQEQSAAVQGTITKVDNQTLSVTNTTGENGQFPISPRIVVYSFRPGSTQASASSDIKTITTGKQALIKLELENGQYQVTSISYLPTP